MTIIDAEVVGKEPGHWSTPFPAQNLEQKTIFMSFFTAVVVLQSSMYQFDFCVYISDDTTKRLLYKWLNVA